MQQLSHSHEIWTAELSATMREFFLLLGMPGSLILDTDCLILGKRPPVVRGGYDDDASGQLHSGHPGNDEIV